MIDRCRRSHWKLGGFFLPLLLGLGTSRLVPQLPGWQAEDELVLMTFNIRYGTADDGPNSWPNRRELVASLIDEHAPDVLAVQEGLAFQLAELETGLEGYRKLGQHRDGGVEGEFSGLYVHENRVELRRWGELWLSPTPDSVGSRGWDAALPRMAVWAEVKRKEGGVPVRVYGTHFDHHGEEARLRSAQLIAEHAEGGPPTVVMGDLNAPEGSAPLKVLSDLGYRSAYSLLHSESEIGTFNGFRDPRGGGRIDHILLGPGLEVRASEILDDRPKGRWPSDHYPVIAVVAPSPGQG